MLGLKLRSNSNNFKMFFKIPQVTRVLQMHLFHLVNRTRFLTILLMIFLEYSY